MAKRPPTPRRRREITIAESVPKSEVQIKGEQISLTVVEKDEDTPDQAKRKKVGDFLALMKKRFKLVSETEAVLRQNMLEDLRFRSSEQWDPSVIADRQIDNRPVITINRIAQFCRQVTNAQRQANLAVKITPVDDGADVKVAEVLQGLVRHIENASDAQVAYATAGESQVTMGRGYWVVDTEYDDEKSFVQSIRIKRVRNPLSIYMDPTTVEIDGSDARFGFEVEDVPYDEYKARFPTSQVASLEEFQAWGSREPDWMPEGKVRICRYWFVEMVASHIYLVQFAGGQQETVTEDELTLLPEGGEWEIIADRPVMRRQVKRALCNAVEILEGNEDKTDGQDWPGQWIPIVPVIGDEIDINGQIDLRGMVRDAKDPQRLYNFQNTALAETLALMPKAPFVGAEGQFEGHEVKWRTVNRRSYPYLEYKVKELTNGTAVGPPSRPQYAADIAGIMTAIQQSDQDLKATMGLYEPSLGIRQESGQSGKAIQALQKQGEMANSNFLDNMSRAIRFTGRIIVDLAPHIYDAPRVVRILGEDEQHSRKVMLMANQPQPPELGPEQLQKDGIEGIYDIGVGKYDVICQAGPSTATKREQALTTLTAFIQQYPDAFPFIGDLLVGALDWPGAQAAAKRLKAAIPPQVQQAMAAEDGGKTPEMLQAEISQLMMQLEMANEALQEAQQLVKGKEMEIQAKANLEMEKLKADVVIANLKGQIEVAKLAAKGEQDAKIKILEAELERQEQIREHAHERAMAAEEHRAERLNAVVERRAKREESDDEFMRQRHAAKEDRGLDREDAAMERARNREDAVMTRQMDREDAAETRQRDREDAHEERKAKRTDTFLTRQLDREDAATTRNADREDRKSERRDNRIDEAVNRQRDRQDAARASLRERLKPQPKKKGK